MKIKYIITFIAVSSILFTGCNKWFDINDDPNNTTEVKINLLLPGIEYDIATDLSLGSTNIGYVCALYTHQISSRESYDNYGINSADYANTVFWADLYSGPLIELEALINLGVEQDNLVYVGVAQILKAYTFSQIVDVWGDVPYSEALQADNFSPVFDDDADIYASLFTLIDEGIANINNTEAENPLLPTTDDLIYQGDQDSWLRFANSLKLKLYTQVQGTSLWNASQVQTLLSSDLIDENSEFLFPFGTSSAPDNRHNGFTDEYGGGQVGTFISPWIYKIMRGKNPDNFTGLEDPRIHYYWCTQHPQDNILREYADLDTVIVGNDTSVYRFVGIYFASNGTFADGGGRDAITMIGIYPCGGKYDEGNLWDLPKSEYDALSTTDGTGAAPMRLLSYADLKYLEAELFNKGLATGDADAAFEEALHASFRLVDKVVTLTGPNQNVPTLYGSADVDSYIAGVIAEYDAASNEKKLEIIMTQKWLQRFGGSSVDSYTDYRRTGYPVLFDPTIHIADGGNDGAEALVPCDISRGYVVSWPWPQDELDLNTNAPPQKNQTTDKVFWDVD